MPPKTRSINDKAVKKAKKPVKPKKTVKPKIVKPKKPVVMGPDTNRSKSGRIAYVFTYNNYTEEQLYEVQNTVGFIPEVTYVDFGKEIGESGTPHLQGQIEFNTEGMKKHP